MGMTNKEAIYMFERYEMIDKSIIHKNIDLAFNTHYDYKNQTGSKRIKIIGKVTQSAYNTVLAWNNNARSTKIPLIKLLQLADALDIPFEYFYEEDATWLDEEVSKQLDKRITELESECDD